jgi:hypothetical protein
LSAGGIKRKFGNVDRPLSTLTGHSRSRQWKSLLLEKHHAFGQAAA